MSKSQAYFEANIKKYNKIHTLLSVKYNRISFLRVVLSIAGLIGIVYFANDSNGLATAIVAFLSIIGFGLLVKWHNRVKFLRNHVRLLININRQEVSRLLGDMTELDGGDEFVTATHHYSSDMDVFGQNSLFKLLNRCTTVAGRSLLARWLTHPADIPTITARQQSIKELSEKSDFCQHFEAIGLHYESDKIKYESLTDWLEDHSVLFFNKKVKIIAIILFIITIVLGILAIVGIINYAFFMPILLFNVFLILHISKKIESITEKTHKSFAILSSLSLLINAIEGSEFSSPLLVKLHSKVGNGQVSKKIKNLATILDYLNGRRNLLYGIFNLVFLIDVILLFLAEKWKETNRHTVRGWFDHVAEIEVLASMGRYAFANEDYAMPSIVEGKLTLEAKELGHPLIPITERVPNDFSINGHGSVAIITGSNMSGKSTFLRTAGVNTILALAGAPVCAKYMQVSRLQLFTSMRTEDNLKEHISSFYAELKRIEQLLALLDSSELPVFYMLDEILKGTNSDDRHKGALALIKQLHTTDSIGFVSTHDLDLGKELDPYDYSDNYSFNSQISDNQLIFEYKIEKRICHSFNASVLMKKIGIKVE